MNYFSIKKIMVYAFAMFSIGALFLLPPSAHAAQMSLSVSGNSLPVGQTVQIDVAVNTEGESVNAVGATLQFPSKLLEFESVRDGSSLINFWVEPAHLSTNDSVSFSGITPGGFTIDQGSIISLLFKTKTEGVADLKLTDIQVLRNDGKGTIIPASEVQSSITIAASAPASTVAIPNDTTPPEPFTIQLSHGNNIFNNKWFIVFATQDKDSGIHHYEVAERRGPLIDVGPNDQRLDWHEAVSPYLLQDQSLKSGVYVRAIDRAGNDRVARLAPQTPLMWYENYQLWGILIIILVLVSIVGVTVWKIKKRRS